MVFIGIFNVGNLPKILNKDVVSLIYIKTDLINRKIAYHEKLEIYHSS